MISGNKKYANEILDDVECYRAVLEGRMKKFPNGFWTKPWSQQSSAIILRYLLEKRLKYTEKDIKEKFCANTLLDNKIAKMIDLFHGHYNALNNAYPGRFKPWELKALPKGFWQNDDNVIQAVRWLVETKLDNNRERVCQEFNSEIVKNNGLIGLLKHGLYRSLNMAYPNEYKPWELGSVSNGFWSNTDNIIEVIRWLVETKLANNRDRVCNEFNTELISRYRTQATSKYGLYELLNMAYPNEFKPWELKSVQNGFWADTENVKKAVRWLVETKLDNNKERVKKEFNVDFVSKHGLASLLRYRVSSLLKMAYPTEF